MRSHNNLGMAWRPGVFFTHKPNLVVINLAEWWFLKKYLYHTNSKYCLKIVGIIPPNIELPFNGCHINACDNLSTGDCAIQEGEELVYEMEIPILDAYPSIEIEGKWMLKDDSGEDFMCFSLPMKIE